MMVPPNMGPEYTDAFARVFPELATEYDIPLMPFLLQDVAAVRENWPVAAYLRETAPIYRVFGIPVTGKTARTVIAPSLAALLTVLRLTGDF